MAGNDEYTKLLLHMDGSQGGHTFTDSSASAHTVERTGTTYTYTDTTTKKLGTASMFVRENSNVPEGLRVANNTDFNFGTGPFTVDFWAYPQRTTYRRNIWGDYSSSNWNKRLSFDETSVEFALTLDGSTNNGVRVYTANSAWTANTWSHIAFVRTGVTDGGQDDWKIFVNGVDQNASVSPSYTGSIGTFGSYQGIGVQSGYITGNNYFGYIDEFRISKGIARWTENFTPPTEPYSEPHSISGILSEEARVLIINQNDWSIEDNTVRAAGAWNYNTVSTDKLVVAVATSDGSTLGYSDVTPIAP
jgi:hypothetical protein